MSMPLVPMTCHAHLRVRYLDDAQIITADRAQTFVSQLEGTASRGYQAVALEIFLSCMLLYYVASERIQELLFSSFTIDKTRV